MPDKTPVALPLKQQARAACYGLSGLYIRAGKSMGLNSVFTQGRKMSDFFTMVWYKDHPRTSGEEVDWIKV